MTLLDDYGSTTTTATSPSRSVAPPTDQLTSDTPTIETPALQRSKPRLQRVRDLFLGSEAIREGGETYLPRFAGETEALYTARSTIAGVFNGYARTVLATVALVTEPEPVLAEDMPPILVTMWENADGAGTHGAVLGKQLVTAAVVDGYAGLFTEYPRADDPRIDRSKASLAATVALATGAELDASDVDALGLRPYFIVMKVDEVLPIYETVNGRRTLVLFIRRETATERKGRFGLESVTRYRVYERQKNGSITYERWSVAAGSGAGGLPVRDEGPTLMRNLTRIPWSPLITGEKLGEHEYKPTLSDLADLNLTHHRIQTGILSLEELACVPTPVRIGATPDEDGNYPDLIMGPGNTIEAPAIQGVSEPVYYLSPPVGVLEPAMKSLETCKREMSTMGATFLAPDAPSQKTATESRIDAGGERATVSSVARAYQDCLESAFADAGQYVRQAAGSVTTNRDFAGEGLDPQLLAQMTAAYQAGGLSLPEYRHYLQTGQLPETFDATDVRGILASLAQPSDTPAAIGTADTAGDTPDDTPRPTTRAPRTARVVKNADGSSTITLD